MKRRPVVFLDRDGTINEEVGYLRHPESLKLIRGAAGALKALKAAGYALVVITNQSGVARGYFDLSDVSRVNKHLLRLLKKEGATVDAIYVCPHHPEGNRPPYNVLCSCRKPAPGLAQQAARDLDLDLTRAYVIGDKLVDLHLAHNLGARGILVLTGYGQRELSRLKAISFCPWRITADIAMAAKAILEGQARSKDGPF